MKTIGAALNRVKPGTRILLKPGIYRETVELRRRHSGTATAPVVLESEKPGTAILSGADIWTGWKAVPGRSGVFSHAWNYTWGFGKDQFAADGAPNGLRGRRSEMVFVNGRSLRQVFRLAEVTPGTFFVTQREKTIYIAPQENIVVAKATIEVAIRDRGIDSGSYWGDQGDYPNWIVLRGLAVRQHRGLIDSSPAVSLCGSHFLVENCNISWNNGTGFGQRADDVVVRNSQFNHNGYSGMVTPPTAYPSSLRVLWEKNETSNNNWRGAMGGFYGYAVGGVKVHRAGDFILRRHTSVSNRCPGVWFDSEDRNILIDGGNFSDNKESDGLCLELSKGPITVRNTRIVNNHTGLGINNASHIALENCLIQGNVNQISGWSPSEDREGYRYGYLTIRKCVIAGTDNQSLFRLPAYPDIYNTLQSRGNRWHRPDGGGWYIGDDSLDFRAWKTRTKQDQDSVFLAIGSGLRVTKKNTAKSGKSL